MLTQMLLQDHPILGSAPRDVALGVQPFHNSISPMKHKSGQVFSTPDHRLQSSNKMMILSSFNDEVNSNLSMMNCNALIK